MIKTETKAAAVVGTPVNLVPCPYCGQTHNLEVIKVQIVSGSKPDYAVKCEGCDCGTMGHQSKTRRTLLELSV